VTALAAVALCQALAAGAAVVEVRVTDASGSYVLRDDFEDMKGRSVSKVLTSVRGRSKRTVSLAAVLGQYPGEPGRLRIEYTLAVASGSPEDAASVSAAFDLRPGEPVEATRCGPLSVRLTVLGDAARRVPRDNVRLELQEGMASCAQVAGDGTEFSVEAPLSKARRIEWTGSVAEPAEGARSVRYELDLSGGSEPAVRRSRTVSLAPRRGHLAAPGVALRLSDAR
jgi:hypothetical protein